MRQEQPKSAKLERHGSTNGGRKSIVTPDLPWQRGLGYYRTAFRRHLGNVGSNKMQDSQLDPD